MKKALALLALMASCSAPSVTFVPAGAQNSLSGSVTTAGAALSNDWDTLGLGDSEVVVSPKINLNFLGSEISISSSSTSFAGSGVLSGALAGGGGSIDAGIDVESELELTWTSLLWTFNFVNMDTAHFGVGLGVTALEHELLIHDPSSVFDDIDPDPGVLPVPLIGLRAGGDVGPIRLEASFATLQFSNDEGEFSVNDVDAYAGYDIIGDTGSIVVGYRSVDMEVSKGLREVELGLGGPYVGIRLSF